VVASDFVPWRARRHRAEAGTVVAIEAIVSRDGGGRAIGLLYGDALVPTAMSGRARAGSSREKGQ